MAQNTPDSRHVSAEIAGLRTRPDFLAVAATKRKWITPAFILQIRTRDEANGTGLIRIGYTASRKVGNAVTRNRAKRRLRAGVRAVFPHLGQPNSDYVLIARSAIGKIKFEKLLSDMEWALKKLTAEADMHVKPKA